MMRSRFASVIALAAFLAAPAFAQTNDQARKPFCSELDHPNAGKVAGKPTGQAQQNAASPVHMDCIADGTATTATARPNTSTAAAGTTTTGKSTIPTSRPPERTPPMATTNSGAASPSGSMSTPSSTAPKG